MKESQPDVNVMYEKLHAKFSNHPGVIDQYSDLRKMLIKSGFKVHIVFRGKSFISNTVAGRYEIWINQLGSSRKSGRGDSLGEAVKDAVNDCKHISWIYQQPENVTVN